MATRNDSWRGGGTGRGAYVLTPNATTQVPLTLQLLASQTANGFNILSSTGSTLFSVDASGNITIAGSVTAVINETLTGNISLTGTLSVTGTSSFTGNVSTVAALTVGTNATFGGVTSAPAMHLRLRTAAPANIGSNGALFTMAGDTSTTELFYLDAAGNSVQITDSGALEGSSLFWDDDEYIRIGNTAASPDIRLGWNTAQTVDALYLGLSDGQNTFVIAENGDRAYDFAHGAQTNPTLYIQSAVQSATQWISFSHNQTNGVIDVGTGVVSIPDGISTAAGTFTGLISGTVAGNTLTLTNSTDAASSQVAIFQGDRATPADNDEAYLTFRLSDSAGNQDEGARITWKATTVADGATQDTDLIFSTVVNNVLTESFRIDGSTGGTILINGTVAYGRLGELIETNASATYAGEALNTWSATDADHASFIDFNRSKSNTIGTHTIVANNDRLGAIIFRGSDGTNFDEAAGISAWVDGTPGAGTDMPGRLVFYTSPDGTATITQRMTILNTGVVTIGGTTNAAYGTVGQLLEINTSSNYGGELLSTWSSSAAHGATLLFAKSASSTIGTHAAVASGELLGQILFRGSDGVEFVSGAAIFAFVDGAVTGGGTDDLPGRLDFRTTPDGSGSPVQRMTILNSGVVTIGGTTNTAYGFVGQLFEVNTSANYGGQALNTWSATGAEAAMFSFNRSKSATIGTHTAVASGDFLGGINFRGSDGNAFRYGASIEAYVDGAVTGGGAADMPGRLEFYTSPDGSATLTERLRITNGGVITTLVAAPANVTALGAGIFRGGIAFTDVLNAWIDDATHGDGTTTLYIGNQTITTASDMRLKENIVDTRLNALETINQLHVVDYSWNEKFGGHEAYNRRGTYTGLLAQEAIEVVPTIINANGGENCLLCLTGKECSDHGDWHVEYDHLIPTLVKAIQELSAKVEALTK